MDHDCARAHIVPATRREWTRQLQCHLDRRGNPAGSRAPFERSGGFRNVSVVCFAIGCGESIPVLVYRVRSRAYRVCANSGGMEPTKGVPERYQDATTTT